MQTSVPQTCVVGKNVNIGTNVTVGENCRIGNNVTLYPDTVLENNVVILDGSVIGRPPIPTRSIARAISNNLPPLLIGSDSVIGANVVLYRGVKVGSNTLIGDLSSIREECNIGDDCIIARGVMINYNTKIGDRVKVMDSAHLTGNMIVEDDVFISIMVATANDNTIIKSGGKSDYGGHVRGPVIRQFATIGVGAILLPGVEIGRGAVVAAGAVVTKNISPNTMVVGIPARPVTQKVNSK